MVTPDRRGVAVERLQERFGVSERRACRVVGQHRSTQRRPKAPPDDAEVRLREHLRDFARRHPRLGWRTAHTVAHREGLVTNAKRTRRLWRDEALQRPPQRKAKRRQLTDGTAGRLRARRPNDVWALDFASTRPPICAASSCPTSSRSSPERPSPSTPRTASTPTASSLPSSASPPAGERRRICAWTTAPNSPPRRCGTGAASGAPAPPASNPAPPGRRPSRVLQRPPARRAPQCRGLRQHHRSPRRPRGLALRARHPPAPPITRRAHPRRLRCALEGAPTPTRTPITPGLTNGSPSPLRRLLGSAGLRPDRLDPIQAILLAPETQIARS